MKRRIIQTRNFEKEIDSLLSKYKILPEDFEDLKRNLVINPEIGDLIIGTGGLRKTRLKSISSGKSGGFRVCYYYAKDDSIYLIYIYSKNSIENITAQDKKNFREIIKIIKSME